MSGGRLPLAPAVVGVTAPGIVPCPAPWTVLRRRAPSDHGTHDPVHRQRIGPPPGHLERPSPAPQSTGQNGQDELRSTRWRVIVNQAHQFCDSPEWRAAVRGQIIPWAIGSVDLGDDVLEIGPGYGATTEVFAELLPRLTSVELDAALADRLRRRYGGTHVEVLLGDATNLALPDGRFSGVVCFSMLHHVPSPELQDRLFAEAGRVLRTGAPIVALDSLASDDLRAFHEGDTYQPVVPATLPKRLEGAGFTDVTVRVNEFGWTALARRM